MIDYEKELKELAVYFQANGMFTDEATMWQVIHHIDSLHRALDFYERERDRFKHAKPEFSGMFFLTGGRGEKDQNMLPEYVTICPAYGAGWEQIYEKTDRTVSYEGS